MSVSRPTDFHPTHLILYNVLLTSSQNENVTLNVTGITQNDEYTYVYEQLFLIDEGKMR